MNAREFLKLHRTYIVEVDRMELVIEKALGGLGDEQEIDRFDDYDDSFEVGGCPPSWVPTPEQLEACWAIGFERAWFKYTDGTERHASKGYGLSEPRAR